MALLSWLKRSTREVSEPERKDRAERAPAAVDEPPAASPSVEDSPAQAPAAAAAAPVATAPPRSAAELGWFTEEQIHACRELGDDENALSREIARLGKGAGREEVLFRHKLSRTVYFREFDLPVLPGTAARVMQLGRDPHASIEAYAAVIQGDPSLVSAIVRLSNSALFSAVVPCETVERAIVRIGVAEVEKISMLHTFNAKLFRVPGHEELVRRLVEHGLTASFAAQAIARELEAPGPEAYLSGLFHDVGKLVLLRTVGEVEHKLGWKADDALIGSCFEAFHTSVGGLLCDSWKFPASIGRTVRDHHDPEVCSASSLCRTVHLANRMAHGIEAEVEPEAFWAAEPRPAGCSLTTERLSRIQRAIADEVETYRGAATGADRN